MKSQSTHTFRNNGILIGMGIAVLFGSVFFSSLLFTVDSDPLDNGISQIHNPLQLKNPISEDISNDESQIFSSKNLYSGPFALLDGSYGVDDTVFLIGSEIPLNSKGKIDFIRPDGEIHHTYPFDGSKSALNHYFTPVSSSDLEACPNCKFFGTWEISFRIDEGISYSPIHFEVINE